MSGIAPSAPSQRILSIPPESSTSSCASAPSTRLIADKAYDADSLRKWLDARRIKVVIPSTASRTIPYPLERLAYKRHNVIKRLFGRLKNWRRIATRYNRFPRNHMAAIVLVAVVAEWT